MMSSRKPRAILREMPHHVKKAIMANLESAERLALRSTCREFRQSSGCWPNQTCELLIDYAGQRIIRLVAYLNLKKVITVFYTLKSDVSASRTTNQMRSRTDSETKIEPLERTRYLEELFSSLKSFLCNPNLRITLLRLVISKGNADNTEFLMEKVEFLTELRTCLASLENKLKVVKFSIFNNQNSDALAILPFLDRTVLDFFSSKNIFEVSRVPDEPLSFESWWDIPNIAVDGVRVEDLPKLFEHFRQSTTLEIFKTNWRFQKVDWTFESLGEDIEWQHDDEQSYGTVGTGTNWITFNLDRDQNLLVIKRNNGGLGKIEQLSLLVCSMMKSFKK